MTKSSDRARHASKAKTAVRRQRKSEARIGEPPKAPDSPFVKTDVTPEDFFKAWSRKDKEALVEVLISSFDQADGDPDEEPLLGAPEVREYHGRRGHVWARGATDDLEDDADDENEHVDDEDDNDDEPSLGSNDGVCQSFWSAGSYDDREGDPGCDDREDVCEDEGSEHDGSESSLGWTDGEAARGLSYAGACGSAYDLEEEHDGCEPDVDDEPSIGGDDREWDDAERSGIGDVEGLLEQTEFGGGCGAAGFAAAVE
jgi:hypothetical protein